MFVNFHIVNTLAATEFRLLMWCHRTQSWGELSILGSCELVRVGSSTPWQTHAPVHVGERFSSNIEGSCCGHSRIYHRLPDGCPKWPSKFILLPAASESIHPPHLRQDSQYILTCISATVMNEKRSTQWGWTPSHVFIDDLDVLVCKMPLVFLTHFYLGLFTFFLMIARSSSYSVS